MMLHTRISSSTKHDLSDVVADGYEAIAKVKEKRYDVVILDIKMPINGTEVLEYFSKYDPQMRGP